MFYRFSNAKSFLVLAPISRNWPCVWLRSHTLQKLKLISVTIFFSSQFHIYYQSDSKRLTTCIISYLIIFVYAFNSCFLTDIYTKLYLEYYFRLLYNVYCEKAEEPNLRTKLSNSNKERQANSKDCTHPRKAREPKDDWHPIEAQQ